MKSGLDGFGLFICGQADTSVGVHGIICGLVVDNKKVHVSVQTEF